MNATKSLRVTDFFSSEEIKAGRMREMIMLRGHKITEGSEIKAMNIRYFISCYAILYVDVKHFSVLSFLRIIVPLLSDA